MFIYITKQMDRSYVENQNKQKLIKIRNKKDLEIILYLL